MKALLIDPKTQTVTNVECTGKLDSIYSLLGCSCIDAPVEFDNLDTLYCDDEGLFSEEITGGITMAGWSYPIVNKTLLLGSNGEGKSVDVKTSAEDLAKQIKWVSKESAEKWAAQFN